MYVLFAFFNRQNYKFIFAFHVFLKKYIDNHNVHPFSRWYYSLGCQSDNETVTISSPKQGIYTSTDLHEHDHRLFFDAPS
jgi:hypothetical protein